MKLQYCQSRQESTLASKLGAFPFLAPSSSRSLCSFSPRSELLQASTTAHAQLLEHR